MFHIDLDIKEDVHVLRRRMQRSSVCFLIQQHFEPFPTRLSIHGIYSHRKGWMVGKINVGTKKQNSHKMTNGTKLWYN